MPDTRQRYIAAELNKVVPSTYTDMVSVRFVGETGGTKYLNITREQFETIKEMLIGKGA